jgi:hypothetical protein
MTDLRTRLAAAAANAHYGEGWDNSNQDDREYWMTVADAVIRELGLRENFAVTDEDGDFVYVSEDRETSDTYTVHPGDHLLRRYVTEWTTDA